ncbi:hypothetical protein SSTU70S_01502 [Stutzerimonas stutzeri]
MQPDANIVKLPNISASVIMELGTSAKMLSIVPLMAGGGMYEQTVLAARHLSMCSS